MSVPATGCYNLGPRQVRVRRLMGYLAINVGVLCSILFVWQNVEDSLRFLVFIPYFLGYLGILQAIQKTCIVYGLQGTQNLDHEKEQVVDTAKRHKLWWRSIWIIFIASLLAVFCTYLTLAIRSELLRWPQAPPLP